MQAHYEAPEFVVLGEAGEITLGGEIWPSLFDQITFMRGFRPQP